MSDLDLSQQVGSFSSQNSPEKKYLSIPGLSNSSSVESPLATSNSQDISLSDLDFSQQHWSPSSQNTQEKRYLSIPGSAGSSSVLSPLHTSNRPVTTVNDRVTRRTRNEVPSPLSVEHNVPSPARPVQKKRKLSEVVGVEDALHELKKLKVSKKRFLWKPVICALSSCDDQQQSKYIPTEFTDSMTNIIHSSLEEESCSFEFLSYALDLISSMIVSRKYPKTDTIQFMMVKLLQNAASESLAIKSYTALMRLLQVHPPTSPLCTTMYMRTLTLGTEEIEDSNQPWQFIRSVIQKIVEISLDSKSDDFNHNIMLLKFLVALLEQNFKFCLQSYAENEMSTKKLSSCMITRVLWPGTSKFTINTKCQELLSFLSSCLSSELDMTQKIQVLPLLLSLISMAAECCRLTEKTSSDVGILLPSKEESAIAFIYELSRNIDVGHTDEQLLGLILRSLQPAWLCVGVCLLLLNNMDDYLVLEGVPRDSTERITLHTIVNKYLFLLPKLQPLEGNGSQRPNTPVSTLKKTTEVSKNETKDTHSKENKFIKNASRANKRNMKGETSLHRACIKNDVINLRKLLKIPGIDINSKDNAGWTPLHEACNHGHIQCVKELLKFVPSKTVDTFFSSGENVCRKADLLLSNNDGVTPLHDAVMNERLDVCRLLLQHGGSALLHCKMVNSATPQDLAVTTNMRNLLLSFEKEEQISSSQGSECTQPSDYLYDQVLRQEGAAPQCSNIEDCTKYICLVTSTIRSYLEAANILTLISLTQTTTPVARGTTPVIRGTTVTEDRDVSSFTGDVTLISLTQTMTPVARGTTPVIRGTTVTEDRDVSSFTGDVSSLPMVVRELDVGLERGTSGMMNQGSDIVDRVKSDLQIARNLKKYVSQFESHMMKISHVVDHPTIKLRIMCLWCLAETSSNPVATVNC
ncbi:SMC5-SMC6 complex localization factor protein 1-like isoform X2 [Pecten maximus]|nr:SMC5-SMC6 complex localization factor protein 1-like isoform X2 [Pecten maximus]